MLPSRLEVGGQLWGVELRERRAIFGKIWPIFIHFYVKPICNWALDINYLAYQRDQVRVREMLFHSKWDHSLVLKGHLEGYWMILIK